MPQPEHKSLLRRMLRWCILGVATLAVVIATAWAGAALHYGNLPWLWARNALCVLWLIGVPVLFVLVRPRKRAFSIFVVAFAVLVVWWVSIPPKAVRDWQPDVAQMATVKVEGDRLTITGVRNFHYRSETDFDQRWETRTYDLGKLKSMELSLTYWGSPAIAHSMVSFVFDDPAKPGGIDTLCASIETRKHGTQQYSTVDGFFRQYELIYIFGDERDLIGLRTNFRHEQVHLYAVAMKPDRVRRVLMAYVDRANRLAVEPEWYNALTQNCFIGVIELVVGTASGPVKWAKIIDYRLLLNGYFDEVMYEAKVVDTSMPLEELRRRTLVNAKVDGGPIGPDFSAKIREGLPRP